MDYKLSTYICSGCGNEVKAFKDLSGVPCTLCNYWVDLPTEGAFVPVEDLKFKEVKVSPLKRDKGRRRGGWVFPQNEGRNRLHTYHFDSHMMKKVDNPGRDHNPDPDYI
jgi:hypothetical protein